jgi:hypothetical protein
MEELQCVRPDARSEEALALPAHRRNFSRDEAKRIKKILAELRQVDSPAQKRLRTELRSMGFYITDYTDAASGFTASEFDYYVAKGTIAVPNRNRVHQQHGLRN